MDHTIENFLEDHHEYQSIFVGNKKFIHESLTSDPEYFIKLSAQEVPLYLIIGCSDSRAPPNYIAKLKPGQLFNHRNIANQVIPGDINVNSVIQYAVLHLKVKHVIVMGHTKCGGIKAALQGDNIGGILDLWISHIKDVYEKYQDDIDEIKDLDSQVDRLCELNVVEQVVNVWKNPYIQSSWLKGHPVWVHGWLFHMENGKLEEIVADKKMPDDFSDAFTFKYENDHIEDKKKLGVTDLIIKPPKKSNRYRQFNDFLHLQTEMMHHVKETPKQIAEFLQTSQCEAIRVNAMEEYKQLKKNDKLNENEEIVEEDIIESILSDKSK